MRNLFYYLFITFDDLKTIKCDPLERVTVATLRLKTTDLFSCTVYTLLMA